MFETFKVTFQPMDVSVEAASGETVLDAAARQDIPIRSDCGGKGLCGKCLVLARPAENLSAPTEAEAELLSLNRIDGTYRLACQAKIKGPLAATLPDELVDRREARGKTDLGGTYPCDPLIERLFLPKAPLPIPEQGTSVELLGWIEERARNATKQEIRFGNPDALRQLALPEAMKGDITLVNHLYRGVTSVLPGRREGRLGVALDLGTTTMAAYLCDLKTGTMLASAASLNPQRRFGEDVISRISLANAHQNGLKDLQGLAAEAVNFLIGRCLDQVGRSGEDVDEVTAVGNTTMEQLFAGLHPHGLGVVPYMPATRSPLDLRAADLGLDLSPGTNIHLFPVISGFVGGDTMGVIMADKPHQRDENCLIVDIGTNGEVVLGNREGLWVTSCATGPALEGAQLSCGMRAVSGAIHKVDIDASTCEFECQVLGDKASTRPLGICGSGVIDAVAAMRRVGLLLPTGRFKEGMPGVICDQKGIGRRVILIPAERSGTGEDIVISLADIRQIQLAKAALAVGIEFLMRRTGIERLDRTVLTGAFGARFDWRNAVTIGMLPQAVLAGEVLPMDNLAGVGAIMALLDRKARLEAADLSERIRFLELAQEPDFAIRFPESTTFPSLESD
jgi:uncharacterized 2Fe-2S/4Fe-4S cluster protein (DUF4445 family)